MQDLEARYGFAKQLANLTDQQLIARFNAEVGNKGGGNARSYFMHCLAAELRSREIAPAVYPAGNP